MRFHPTPLPGAYVVDLEPRTDERGFFARAWCEREFEEHGLNARLVQCDVSFNHRAGTLRGMHQQRAPFAQAKLVRCTRGGIFDVIVDTRPESSTFGQFFATHLTAENRRMLFIPEGFAHGFQTLVDATEVFYQMSSPYVPEAGVGFRWDDPAVSIPWPIPDAIMNERDRSYPFLAAPV